MSHINAILATGRKLNDVEAELVELGPRDERRAELSQQASQLQAHQTDQIAAALRDGVAEETIRFALDLHGQGANRELWRTTPTPAEHLAALITLYGAPRVVEALDAFRAQLAATSGEDG